MLSLTISKRKSMHFTNKLMGNVHGDLCFSKNSFNERVEYLSNIIMATGHFLLLLFYDYMR